ncbi:MAG: group II intron reverse transcriptase/maturase [Candidatus Entotheonellia bacterium]
MTHGPQDFKGEVCTWDNLLAAWRAVRRNKGQSGSDGVSLADFDRDHLTRLREMQQRLRARTYYPQPLRPVLIPKANHRQRLLRIPTVADRIVQQAILQVIEPRFERKFCNCSFGFRPGRSAHQAVDAIQTLLAQGLVWVVEADLEDFFDTLDWGILLSELGQEIPDQSLLGLIRCFLQAGLLQGQQLTPVTRGTPQGAVFSPLLGNAYLHPFDTAMSERGLRLIRYGDDLVTFHRTRTEAAEGLLCMKAFLRDRLKLRLNGAKTGILHEAAQGFEFLSFYFARGRMVPAAKAVERFKAEVQRIINERHRRRGEPLAARLDPLIRGWGEYFKIAQVEQLYPELDTWVGQRLGALPAPGFRVASLTTLLAKRGRGTQGGALARVRTHATSSREV